MLIQAFNKISFLNDFWPINQKNLVKSEIIQKHKMLHTKKKGFHISVIETEAAYF